MDLNSDFNPEDLPTSPPPDHQSRSPIDQSEVQGYLNEYQYASEPSYFARPNRYHGPPSTWRSWTADDRVVAESLDVMRASDLSIHLYNAFDLKRRSKSAPHARHYEARVRTGDRSASDDDQEIIHHEFTPPEVWTAWPLRSHHVPRYSGSFDIGDDLRPRTRRIKPSTTLEDALAATTLRHARRRWEARKSEPKLPQTKSTNRRWKEVHDTGEREPDHPASTAQEDDNQESAQSNGRDATPGLEADLNAVDDVSMEENLPEGVQFFSSQAFATVDSSSSSEDEVSTTNSEEEYPVFSVDDDLAHNILRPSIRHLLTRFDDLLDGLHKARAAYAMREDKASSRSRSRSVFSDTEITEDDRFVRSGSRAAIKKRGRKRKLSPHPSDSRELPRSMSRGRSTVRISDKKNQAYALRDWSDVLGMATLTGWNVETVARASERCAKLFNQNMTFRTFHQGSLDGGVAPQEKPWFEEEAAYAPIVDEDAIYNRCHYESEMETERGQKVECIRTSSRCPRCEHHKIRCDAPKSISTRDFTQPVACVACSSSANLDVPCPGIFIQIKLTTKTCPYPDCARHDPTKSFMKRYHLQRHLTDVHGHIYSPPTSPMWEDHISDNQFDVTTEDQIRPSATLTCPIVSCSFRKRVYKRPTRLYDHIRKVHREFDVSSLKKLIAKTSGRGRYDRSRSRSRSQGRAPAQDDVVDLLEKHDDKSEDEAHGAIDLEDDILGEKDE